MLVMEEKWQKMNIMRIRKKELIAEVKNQIFNKTSTREIKKKNVNYLGECGNFLLIFQSWCKYGRLYSIETKWRILAVNISTWRDNEWKLFDNEMVIYQKFFKVASVRNSFLSGKYANLQKTTRKILNSADFENVCLNNSISDITILTFMF